MDRIVGGISTFAEAYVDYLCHDQIIQGFYVNDYHCEGIEVVDYIIKNVQADSIQGPFQVDEIPKSNAIIRIAILDRGSDTIIPHGIIIFIKSPKEMIIGQSVRGLTAFNLYYTNYDNLITNLNEAREGNLSPITRISLQYTQPEVRIDCYKTKGLVKLRLPKITPNQQTVITRARDQFIEYQLNNMGCEWTFSQIQGKTKPVLMGNLVTELDSAIYMMVKKQREMQIH